MSSNGLDLEEPFEFSPESPEYKRLAALAKEWLEGPGEGKRIYGCASGEAGADHFKEFVQKHHPDVAKLVERDGMIYDAAVMDWHMTKI